MNPISIQKLLQKDPRYKLDAYQFVRDALAFAHDVMQLDSETQRPRDDELEERHLTGQQLCHAIRELAVEQYGYMAKPVLNSWGIHSTSDFGEIVYNLIQIGAMKKSPHDRREDFNDVYCFEDVFQRQFRITQPEQNRPG